MGFASTLELPYPRLVEGRFASIDALTDEDLFSATGVRIAFTERMGGVSLSPYDSLNLGDHVDDDPQSVSRNRGLLLEAFGAQGADMVNPLQVHGDVVVSIGSRDSFARAREEAREGADSIVVGCDDVAALLCFADCMPVIIVSPDGSFAVVHAGWRGVANRIAVRSAEHLSRLSGHAPSSFNVYMGPFIHACHFQVSDDLADSFATAFGRHVVSASDDGSSVDLGEAMRVQLHAAGIQPSRIADAGVCTVCDQDRFFSYRGSGGVCGRHGAFAVRVSGAGDSMRKEESDGSSR